MAKREINRDPIVDLIATWMANNCPSFTVDTLLGRTIEKTLMGLDVGVRTKQISRPEANAIRAILRRLTTKHPEALDVIDGIARLAMNSRKKGLLKPDRV